MHGDMKVKYLDIMVVCSQYRDRATFMALLELYIILEAENMMQYFITGSTGQTLPMWDIATKNVKLEELCSWTWFFPVHWEHFDPHCGTRSVRT